MGRHRSWSRGSHINEKAYHENHMHNTYWDWLEDYGHTHSLFPASLLPCTGQKSRIVCIYGYLKSRNYQNMGAFWKRFGYVTMCLLELLKYSSSVFMCYAELKVNWCVLMLVSLHCLGCTSMGHSKTRTSCQCEHLKPADYYYMGVFLGV